MKTGTLLAIGAILTGSIYAFASGKKEDVPVSDELPPVKEKITPVKVVYSDRIAKIQAFLNTVPDFAKRKILTVDGQNGPSTTSRIKEFQLLLKAKYPNQGVTGIWGEQTEENALKLFGKTPFQNLPQGPKNNTPTPFSALERIEQDKLRARLINRQAFGVNVPINVKSKPDVVAPVQEVISNPRYTHVGIVVDVAFQKSPNSGITRTFLNLKRAGKNIGWVNLTDISIYNDLLKSSRLAGEFINGL